MKRFLSLTVFAWFGCSLAITCSARASLILTVDPVGGVQSPTSTTTGFFDIYFKVQLPDSSAPLAGYQVKLNLVGTGGASGMTITGTSNTSAPHAPIFPTTPPSDSSTSTFAQATAFLSSGANPITDTAGLVRVNYSLAAGAHGTYNLNIDTANTFLADNGSNSIPFTTSNGTFTIVPEPSTLALVSAFGAATLLTRRRRRSVA